MPRLAKSLTKLREQLNVAHLSRATVNDRDIGDEYDHIPSEGVVLGLDVTHDPENGIDGHVLSRTLAQDSRVNYVIFHDEIWRCYVPAWTKHTPYLPHIHVSVLASLADDDSEWSL